MALLTLPVLATHWINPIVILGLMAAGSVLAMTGLLLLVYRRPPGAIPPVLRDNLNSAVEDTPCEERHKLEQEVITAVRDTSASTGIDQARARDRERAAVEALDAHIKEHRCRVPKSAPK